MIFDVVTGRYVNVRRWELEEYEGDWCLTFLLGWPVPPRRIGKPKRTTTEIWSPY